MTLFYVSITLLIILYIGAKISTVVFKIYNDAFYSPFHFAAGVATSMFFWSLTQNIIISIVGTIIIGLLWEVWERIEWKYFLKDKRLKPKKMDTIYDLFYDTLGAVITILSITLLK